MSTFTVRRLIEPSEKEIDAAVIATAEAFNYNFFSFALGGDTEEVKRERVIAQIRAHVTAGLVEGEVWVAENPKDGIAAAAVWFGPGNEFLRTPSQRSVGWDELQEQLEPVNRDWWTYFLATYNAFVDSRLGPGVKLGSYHLQLLGTHPNHQKKGLSTALLKAIEAKAKVEGKVTVIETVGELNAGIYQKLGYRVGGLSDKMNLPDNTPAFQMYVFIKEPADM